MLNNYLYDFLSHAVFARSIAKIRKDNIKKQVTGDKKLDSECLIF